ncbi:MAG: Tetratricopeptide 1 repeat-containing protein [Planctomycetaceae bacterium]|jgi:hypothetical protein|nr:Tetratricopeptide 1 repeat-containing protein [Planctomycetaceae bacterium]
MSTIRIREQGGGGEAEVSFDNEAGYRIQVQDPFTEADEKRLEWYFEEHLRFPFVDQVRARQAGQSIARYGEQLFGQVFSDDEHGRSL